MGGSWRDGLNAQQRRAAEHEGGPLLVVAGAGTGKTTTLAARVAALLDRGIPPERLLLLTFTRRAAAEMLERAGRMTDPRVAGRVVGGTFHSVAVRLLRANADAVGLEGGFTVLDPADATDVVRLVRDDLGLGRGSGRRRVPKAETILAIASRVVDAREPLSEVVARHHPWCADHLDAVRDVLAGYTARKRAQRLLDFDDLLLFWHALAAAPQARLGDAFDHVLVDEYQDTNALQAGIVRALRTTRDDVCAVGDDAQAIYGFRAATVRNILDFPAQFPGCEVVLLERNYRSTAPLLAASNAVIAQAGERYRKELVADRGGGPRPVLATCADQAVQATAVCDAVLELREQGVGLDAQAVLFRAGHHSDLLELELARRDVPFVKYGGLTFLQRAHVKDLCAALRVLENPFDDVAWFRLLQLVEGIGPATARSLLAAIGARPRRDDADPVAALAEPGVPVPATARAELADLAGALAAAAAGPPLAQQLGRLLAALEPLLRRAYDHADARVADLAQLATLAAGHDDRSRLVTELTLEPPARTGDLAGPPHRDEEHLVLSTIHSAKGCEWEAVHVLNAADGDIPSDMAAGDRAGIDEERRLLYVALTRARTHLRVWAPLRYHHRPRARDDAHNLAQLSRFLTPEVRERFDLRAVDAPSVAAHPTVAAPVQVGAAVDAVLADLWAS